MKYKTKVSVALLLEQTVCFFTQTLGNIAEKYYFINKHLK